MNTEIVIASVAVFCVAAVCILAWRMASLIARSGAEASRLAERRATAAERWLMQWIEKTTADDEPAERFRLANLHAGEATRAMAGHLKRDAEAEHVTAKARREMMGLNREPQVAADYNPNDTHG